MEPIENFLLGNEKWTFLLEVMLRCLIGFTTVIIAIRLTGKRGVRQLSLFEVVIILTLGSAAGDIAFYKDVGVLPAVLTILTIVFLYKIITFLLLKSRKFGKLIEGEPIVLIEDGRFTADIIRDENISFDEFYMELREGGIEHLGQVRKAILEVDGDVSLFKNEGKEVKAGLCIFPDIISQLYVVIPEDGLYSCVQCGYTTTLRSGHEAACGSCHHTKWGRASTRGCLSD